MFWYRTFSESGDSETVQFCSFTRITMFSQSALNIWTPAAPHLQCLHYGIQVCSTVWQKLTCCSFFWIFFPGICLFFLDEKALERQPFWGERGGILAPVQFKDQEFLQLVTGTKNYCLKTRPKLGFTFVGWPSVKEHFSLLPLWTIFQKIQWVFPVSCNFLKSPYMVQLSMSNLVS